MFWPNKISNAELHWNAANLVRCEKKMRWTPAEKRGSDDRKRCGRDAKIEKWRFSGGVEGQMAKLAVDRPLHGLPRYMCVYHMCRRSK